MAMVFKNSIFHDLSRYFKGKASMLAVTFPTIKARVGDANKNELRIMVRKHHCPVLWLSLLGHYRRSFDEGEISSSGKG